MTARVLTLAAAVALVLACASGALAASPSSVSIGPSGGAASWSGTVKFSLTGSSSDSATVNVHGPGTLSVSITWSLPTSNLDLVVTKGGSTVASSARLTGTSESVTISGANGTYVAQAKPKLINVSTSYSGSASFSPPPPPPSPKPSPKPSPTGGGSGGGGGGGSGGGGGGGGSRGGGGTSGGSGGSTSGNPGGYGFAGSGVPSSYYSGFPTSNSFYPGVGYGASSSLGGTSDQRSVTFQPVYGSAGSGGSNAEALPASSSVPVSPGDLWLLLPLGLLTFAVAAYVVFDPESDVVVRRVGEADGAGLAVVPPTGLAAVVVRSVSALGRVAATARRAVGRRRSRSA